MDEVLLDRIAELGEFISHGVEAADRIVVVVGIGSRHGVKGLKLLLAFAYWRGGEGIE